MATYTSKPVAVALTPAELSENFSDIGEVAFTRDTIEISTPQVGKIVLRATERTPEGVVMKAENSPVPMAIDIRFRAAGAGSEVTCAMDVEIPMMLRALVGPAMQKAVDQFGNLFAKLA